MRMIVIAAATAGLALAGCSEQTQDSAEEFAESAAADAAANTEEVLSEGAAVAGNAAESLDREVAETEAEAHNESVAGAQAD